MAEFQVYIAVSRDGFIADENGSVDWLEPFDNPDGDYGYGDFLAKVSTLVMGKTTFDQVVDFGDWPYAACLNIVLTHDADATTDIAGVEFSSAPITEIANELSSQDGNVWVMGGADVIQQFLKAGLIDSLEIFTMPITLNSGVALFTDDRWRERFVLKAETTYGNCVKQALYYAT